MIDTHTHLYLRAFPDGGVSAVEKALEEGVSYLIFPNVDATTIEPMMKLHSKFPENTSVALALHPTELGDDWETVIDDMEKELEKGGYVAIGETGIDLYWDKENLENQQKAFERHLLIAQRLGLPVIIHSRDALDETLEVIKKVNPTVPLLFHSFTAGPEAVRKIREVCDAWFGINGVVTFKNAQELRDALPEIGIERIVLETDSPYLAPVPYRGKRNESAYLKHILKAVSDTLKLSERETEKITDSNAKKIFRIA